ncbi:MAG TPA: B12-binding domain-containing radical SAM protein, partial [Vicinamibacteria bacterium]|nr:B12-binding domain-containing radical SAM protein [Vicinamibacteria bacterium]
LLYRTRALRLLELMRRNGKDWSLYVFSSANTLKLYSMEELVGLGVSWLWMGLEGRESAYVKLRGADTRSLVDALQAHGIRVLGSTIIGLPEHTPQNADAAIAHAVEHDTEFHQFMLYTPVPGTPLYAQHQAQGTLLDSGQCPEADTHGQLRFNFRHPNIPAGQETDLLLRAFRTDFERNGPSVIRITRTLLRGWRRHKDDPDPRVRRRYRRECRHLATAHAGALWAARRWLAGSAAPAARLRALQHEIGREFGLKARLLAPLIGRFLLAAMRREQRRLASGHMDEPPTFYETNRPRPERPPAGGPVPCRWVAARAAGPTSGASAVEGITFPATAAAPLRRSC